MLNNHEQTAVGLRSATAQSRRFALLALAYVILVLGVDLLATHRIHFLIDWTWFDWRPARLMRYYFEAGRPVPGIIGDILDSPLRGFDCYKFLFWLLIPLALCLRGFDWQQFTFHRWKRIDFALLAGAVVLGALAVALITLIPQLKTFYPSMAHHPAEQKWAFILYLSVWNLSWLPGWEFLFRYFLLRRLEAWRTRAWLLLPLLEGAYHLQKHPLEALGMVLFSLAATAWARNRKNMLLPLLAHAALEMTLLVFLILF